MHSALFYGQLNIVAFQEYRSLDHKYKQMKDSKDAGEK
jgi:hypothetical protein